MEQTIHLSLNQVNFESYNLGDCDFNSEPLHSFSNVVCFDSDFKTPDSDGLPVAAKKITFSPGRNVKRSESSSIDNSGGDSSNNIGNNNGYIDAASDNSFELYSYSTDTQLVGTSALISSMETESLPTICNTQSMSDSGSVSMQLVENDASETFRAFTETVEALALQRSVIGNINVVPASAEEISKAIAAAQAKIQQQQHLGSSNDVGTELDSHGHSSVFDNNSQHLHHQIGTYGEGQMTLERAGGRDKLETADDDIGPVWSGGRGPMWSSGEGVEITPVRSDNIPSGSRLGSVHSAVKSAESSSESRQLIRISADSIRTESTPRSSWFWSNKSTRDDTKIASVRKNHLQKSAPCDTEHHGLGGLEAGGDRSVIGERQEDRVRVERADGKPDFTASSGYVNIDYFRNEGRNDFMEHILGKSQSVANNDSGKFVSSHSTALTDDDLVHYVGQHTELPMSPLSYAFVLPETSIPARYVDDNSFNVNNSCNNLLSRQSDCTPFSLSRQSSSLQSPGCDDRHVEQLLHDKAALEGRLQVLERENSEMLRQQAELKQRIATAEQHTKHLLESPTNVNKKTNDSLTVDVDSLRQSRCRLEAVILDAHTLLADKDQEIRTLERDLELARLAGEKHLERVADCKREISSREATVRDLKSKITELYVRSQTSDESRKLTEGELAAIRADLSALMEAKEWYAGQLRATQKDRSKLQAETTAARAETINIGVLAERLRAENARLKRNLSEMEQRVLAEKRTLARHLEEIEADMLEREATYTAQLRQAAESTDNRTVRLTIGEETEEVETVRSELKRSADNAELLRRDNVDLSRRLALAQQCVIDRDAIIKSLETDRETAELRAEAAEQNAALSAADVQRLERQRAELQVQVEASANEKIVFDESLQTLKRDTVLLETNFRRMQTELANKSVELERLAMLRTVSNGEKLSELWPDPETAAGLRGVAENIANNMENVSQLSRETIDSSCGDAVVIPLKCCVEVQTDAWENYPEIPVLDTTTRECIIVDSRSVKSVELLSHVDRSPEIVELAGIHHSPGKTLAQKLEETTNAVAELRANLLEANVEKLECVRQQLAAYMEQLKLTGTVETSDMWKSCLETEMAEKCRQLEELREKLLKSDEELFVTRQQLDRQMEKWSGAPGVEQDNGRQLPGVEQDNGTLLPGVEQDNGRQLDLEMQLSEKCRQMEMLHNQLLMSDKRLADTQLELNNYIENCKQLESQKQLSSVSDDKKHLETSLIDKTSEMVEEQRTASPLEATGYLEHIKQLEEEKSAADSERMVAMKRLETLEVELDRVNADRQTLQQRIQQQTSEILELQSRHIETSAAVHDNQLANLQTDNTQLQARLTQLQQDSQRQVTKLKSKVLKLTKQLEIMTTSHSHQVETLTELTTQLTTVKDTNQQLEAELTAVTDTNQRLEAELTAVTDTNQQLEAELTAVTDTNQRLEAELDVTRECNVRLQNELDESLKRSTMDADEHTTTLQNHLQMVLSELEASNTTCHQLQLELNSVQSDRHTITAEYSEQIRKFEAEIQHLETRLVEQQLIEERAAILALELDKHKGCIAGLEQSYNALKQHSESLEERLVKQTSTKQQQDDVSQQEINRRDGQLNELNDRITQLDTALMKEKQTVKDFRAQLMMEKGNHIKVRRQLEQVTIEHTQLVADSQQMQDSLSKMAADVESLSAREIELKLCIERLTMELRVAQLDKERLERELDDLKTRDTTLQDNIQGLEWRLTQKDIEISASQEKLELVEDRQHTELTTITQTLQSTRAELSSVRDELLIVKKDKSDLQLKMTQLRVALQSALSSKIDLSVATETTAELQRLLRDSAPAAVSNKPLSFLQATLSGLRGEITSLQSQINEHTTAVQSSSMAWRELEAQVQDLREVCKTSAADRAAAAAAAAVSITCESASPPPVGSNTDSPDCSSLSQT